MGQHTTRWPVVQWLLWCCLMSTLLESSRAVCNDTRGETDSGGDNCSFYDEQPQFCGCCDTPSFIADRDCCACGQRPQGTAAWWTEVFHAWPRKAVSLRLEGKGLFGTLPRSLGLLAKLKSLQLSGNHLTGSLPPELGDLSDLEQIDLSMNRLSGSLPAELGKLSRLQSLSLHNNQFSGSLPPELGNLSRLQEAQLRDNQLSGSIPAELGQLSQLQGLFLHRNQFSGHVPVELAKLSQLQILNLGSNQLRGSIPAELGMLSQLQRLNLHGNQLSGSIPVELAKLSQLQRLVLYENHLNGSLPAELGNLSQLQRLMVHENQLSGSLPAELGRLSQLMWLDLSSNKFSGSLPAELGNLSQLFYLFLFQNQLSGSLPPELGKLSRLGFMDIYSNKFSGSLPAELGNLSQLRDLGLSNNTLSGSLPAELGKLSWLRNIWLHSNQLSGSLPPELGNLSRLRWLLLYDNQLNGSLPAELGNLSMLEELDLHNNRFSGSLPAELGKLSQLTHLDLHDNELSGRLPAELGNLSHLQRLDLDRNRLEGGIPTTWSGMSLLEVFRVKYNPQFCGGTGTDAITELQSLKRLELRGCCFETIAPPPAGLEVLDLGENRLTAVPDGFQRLPNMTTLLLDRNSIEQWDTSSAMPLSWYARQICGIDEWPTSPRLDWPSLVLLNVSANSFGPPVHDFLATLVHVPRLRVLLAADNRLSGGMPVPPRADSFMENRENSGYDNCTGWIEALRPEVFPALDTLDLSRNHITHMLSFPPGTLVQIDLTGNRLAPSGLADSWWQGTAASALQLVSVQRNPDLRLPIRLDPGSSCAGVDQRLAANPQAWIPAASELAAASAAGPASECTSLCWRLPRVLVDASAKEEVLCRCSAGHQGTGLNCTACPNDTYSVQSFDHNTGRYERRCRRCPLHSQLRASTGQCFGDCSCDAGYFMQRTAGENGTADLGIATCSLLLAEGQLRGQGVEGECRPCDIWRTSKAGSRAEADCFCNGDLSRGGWSGLLQQGSDCRCSAGESMDFAQRKCVACHVAEICTDPAKSLQPPDVKAGYWALPPPLKGDGTYGNFSRHVIWRCDSQEACPGNFSCGMNRSGTACSLCQRGSFRTPGGGCLQCSRSYTATRLLLLGVLITSTVLPLLTHGLMSLCDDSSRNQVLALRSLRISLKQLLKFVQILGVVSLFQVEWPDLVLSVFQVFRAFSVDLASWMGVACLDAQQQESVALELAFRWMLPFLAATVTAASAAAATTCGVFCRRRRETRLGRLLTFRFFDVLRVLLFLLQLFYPSVLKNAVLPLTCSPSPNGHLTLNMYPHMVCFDLKHDASSWALALLGGAYSVLLIMGYPLLLFRLRRRLSELVEEDEIASATWWTFIFDDFRSDSRLFVLMVVGKDILLNLIPVVLPGLGTFQLLVTAVVCSAYALRVHVCVPFHDTSNTVLEACTSAAVAILCVFSAGMGFQSEPEVLDISSYLKNGRRNPIYLQRALTLLCLQSLSLFAPAAIIAFQVLAGFERTRRFLPRSLVRASDEQLQVWRSNVYASLDQLDDVALANVHRWVQSATKVHRVKSSSSTTKDGPENTDVEQPGEEPPQSSHARQRKDEPHATVPSHPSQRADEPQATVPRQPTEVPPQPNQPSQEPQVTSPSQPTHEPQDAVLGRVSL